MNPIKILAVEISYGDENAEKTFFTDNFGVIQSNIKNFWKTTDKFSIIITSMKNRWTKKEIAIKVILDLPFKEFDKVNEWVKDIFPKYIKIRVGGTGDWYKNSPHPEWGEKIQLQMFIDKMNEQMGSINENGIKRTEKFYAILQKQLNYQE